MSAVRYNEEQEAYELDYELWDRPVTVRFYVESEQDIMDNIGDIADKFDRLNRNRSKLAEIIIRDRWTKRSLLTLDPGDLAKDMYIADCSVEIDEDGIVLCLTAASEKYLDKGLSMEIGDDHGLEVLGTVDN